MIGDLAAFLTYWPNARARTLRVLEALEPGDLDWRPAPGAFSFADLFRHLAAIERHMWAENVLGRPGTYPGPEPEPGALRAHLDRCHEESMACFRQLREEDLTRPCRNDAGATLSTWKCLRAMAEHEAHHRGQLYLMASLRGRRVAPLFGLTEEELRARSGSPG